MLTNRQTTVDYVMLVSAISHQVSGHFCHSVPFQLSVLLSVHCQWPIHPLRSSFSSSSSGAFFRCCFSSCPQLTFLTMFSQALGSSQSLLGLHGSTFL